MLGLAPAQCPWFDELKDYKNTLLSAVVEVTLSEVAFSQQAVCKIPYLP